MKVGFDIDGVLAFFSYDFSKSLRKMHGNHLPLVFSQSQVLHYDWHLWYPLPKSKIDETWNLIHSNPDYFLKLPPLPTEAEFTHLLGNIAKNEAIDTYFITARKSTSKITAGKQTTSWLVKHGWENPNVITTSSKKGLLTHALGLDFMIEDSGENALDIVAQAPQCKVFLIDCPYNKHIDHPQVQRVYTITEYIDAIKRKEIKS